MEEAPSLPSRMQLAIEEFSRSVKDITEKKRPDNENPDGHIPTKQNLTTEDVDAILVAAGIEDASRVSKCLRGGQKRYISFTSENPLKEVVIRSPCRECFEYLTVTVEDLLYQPDDSALDWEEGGLCASVRCSNEECAGIYVTRICEGTPKFDSGKYHKHCTQCKDFGTCIGDCREVHCRSCGRHYFAGLQGFPCPWQGGDQGERIYFNDCIDMIYF